VSDDMDDENDETETGIVRYSRLLADLKPAVYTTETAETGYSPFSGPLADCSIARSA